MPDSTSVPRKDWDMTTLHGIGDLVIALRELGSVLQPVRVAATLRGVRIDERTLKPYFTWEPGRYTRNLVHRDDAFELIAICWEKDARSAIHDHADSDCAFVLQNGAITCENYRVAWAEGHAKGACELRHTSTRTLRNGEIDMRSGHLSVHRVASCDGRAVTLHVYAKPIDECLAYDDDGAYRVSLSKYDSVPTASAAD
ncbi:MAG: cysteine dioxygenase [Candidatus Eremiobacteraeota bacterium]|jgi:cysteine dioxygenase|nr:cysteine dioxygenase [Candidatus Eremiobacteraeota bacterium]